LSGVFLSDQVAPRPKSGLRLAFALRLSIEIDFVSHDQRGGAKVAGEAGVGAALVGEGSCPSSRWQASCRPG